jgi:hypothetical protein
MVARELAQGSSEISGRWNQAHVAGHRLDNDGGDGGALRLEGVFQGLGIVVGQHQSILGAAFRDARAVGHAQRGGR